LACSIPSHGGPNLARRASRRFHQVTPERREQSPPIDVRPAGVRTEPSGKRVCVFLGGTCIVDSCDAEYVWEARPYPQYYLPRRDFADGVLEPSGTTRPLPGLGTAR